MSVFNVVRGTIPRLPQRITINGEDDSRLWCINISQQSGPGSLTATFAYPEALFDTDRSTLKDALVKVWILNPYDGSAGSYPDFIGYLDAESAELEPGGEHVEMTGTSAGAYLKDIYVGQTGYPFSPVPVVEYRLTDPITGLPTRNTPETALKDIFEKMPSRYRNRIKLGDTDVLRCVVSDAPSLIFRSMSYSAALDYVLAFYGDVAIRERAGSSAIYLDFYRVNSASSGLRSVRVAVKGERACDGPNVASMRDGSSVQDVKTRAVVFGRRKRFMLSAQSAPVYAKHTKDLVPKKWLNQMSALGEATAGKALQRDWAATWESKACLGIKGDVKVSILASTSGPYVPNYSATDTVFNIKTGTAIDVGAVLQAKNGEKMLVSAYTAAQNEGTQSETPATVTVTRGYAETTAVAVLKGDSLLWDMPGIEHCFRRYKLPACFNGISKLKDNLLKRSNLEKTPYSVQVWSYPVVQDKSETGVSYGVIQSKPKLIKNCSIDLDKNTITLGEPALVEYSYSPPADKGRPVIAYAETVVGITFTVESDQWLYHDTGAVDNGDIELDFAPDGLYERPPIYDDLGFDQLTNKGYPVNGLEFDCCYFDEDTGEFVTQTTADVRVDDTDKLRAQARQILSERNRRHVSRQIRIPWFTRGYSVGNQLDVYGLRNQRYGEFVITGISWNVDSREPHDTILQLDNVKPPKRLEVSGEF